jgi:hypothetical protein
VFLSSADSNVAVSRLKEFAVEHLAQFNLLEIWRAYLRTRLGVLWMLQLESVLTFVNFPKTEPSKMCVNCPTWLQFFLLYVLCLLMPPETVAGILLSDRHSGPVMAGTIAIMVMVCMMLIFMFPIIGY